MEREKLRVLLIEDNLGDARLINEMISDVEGAGIQMDHSFRLSTGLERLSKGTYDAILLDLGLPDSNGLDTLRKVHARANDIPIIVMTFNEGEETGLKAMQIGAQDYLIKLQIDGVLLVRSLRYAVERKKIEEKLRDSEDRFRATFEQAAVGIALVDLNGKWLRVNQKFCTMIGYTTYELLLISVHDVTYPEDIEADSIIFQKMLSGEIKSHSMEKRFLRKDGSLLWVYLTVSTSCDAQGKPTYYITVMEDITERKQSEKNLKETTQLLTSIVDHTNMMLVYMDTQFNILRVNQAFADASGCEITSFKRMNFFELAPDKETRDILNKVVESGEVYNEYGRKLNCFPDPKTKGYLWHFSLVPLKNEVDGVTGLVMTLINVTEQINNEAALKKSEEGLRESEERYHHLFLTMAQGVVYQNAAGQITSANPAAEKILGLTIEEMRSRTSFSPQFRAIHEDGSEFPGDSHPSIIALNTGREVKDVIMGVYNPREKEYRWIKINAIPLFGKNETRPYQVYTSFEDITELKRTERFLRESDGYL